MNENFEAAQASADYLDVLVRIADKYKINREKFVRDTMVVMVCACASVNYEKYKPGDDKDVTAKVKVLECFGKAVAESV